MDPGSGAHNGDWKAYWADRVTSELHLTPSESVNADQVLNIQRTAVAGLADDCELLREIYLTVDRIIPW
ncbi:hypothetical protein G7072_02255 [Nocardioides sp. HDW12B]|uniref:hypothetical protein n=1 Tax=Nocardioides sp. HDW12B TaxID=2714939 RepID=UPI001409E7BC|nr:hypothetical protein [Nocardioides sp. HDW12B]QIK65319.1 hypothetical protein G7072_02255 [Nocardioides sp. HDW12B]